MAKKISTTKTATKKAATKKATAKKVATKSTSSKNKKAKSSSVDEVEHLHQLIVEAIQSKKAKDIVSLDLRKIDDAVANYFVICSGDVNTHIKAIADSAEEEVRKKIGEKPWHAEGFENLEWVIVDYVNVVLHIFKKDIRDFYRLEDLWSDAEKKVFD